MSADICAVCLLFFNVLEDITSPYNIVPCCHTFCKKCILALKQNKCPSCREEFDPKKITKNFTAVQLLEKKCQAGIPICDKTNRPKDQFCRECIKLECIECQENFHEENQLGHSKLTKINLKGNPLFTMLENLSPVEKKKSQLTIKEDINQLIEAMNSTLHEYQSSLDPYCPDRFDINHVVKEYTANGQVDFTEFTNLDYFISLRSKLQEVYKFMQNLPDKKLTKEAFQPEELYASRPSTAQSFKPVDLSRTASSAQLGRSISSANTMASQNFLKKSTSNDLGEMLDEFGLSNVDLTISGMSKPTVITNTPATFRSPKPIKKATLITPNVKPASKPDELDNDW